MNDQEINIAIAEACGWTDIQAAPYDMRHVERGDLEGKFAGQWNKIPNYTTDLNAMHGAEKVLTFSQGITYGKFLHVVCNDATDVPDFDFMAPARQRAEAFLKTIGKWKEGE